MPVRFPHGHCYSQGRQGSNLRPSILETDALPTELLPYACFPSGCTPDSVPRLRAFRHLSHAARILFSRRVVATMSRGVTAFDIATATGPNFSPCACALRSKPSPPALLPVGHSPGRGCCQPRRWSLTPPLAAFTNPFLRRSGEVLFAVAVVVAASLPLPCLLFRTATIYMGVGKFLAWIAPERLHTRRSPDWSSKPHSTCARAVCKIPCLLDFDARSGAFILVFQHPANPQIRQGASHGRSIQ